MSLHFGYDAKKEEHPSFTGGEMKSDIDMNNTSLKNLADPVDNGDAVNKLSMERHVTSEIKTHSDDHIKKFHKKLTYCICFNINISKAVANNDVTQHNNSNQIKQITDGEYNLHQDDLTQGPILGKRAGEYFISSETVSSTPLTMLFTCPKFAHADISVFVVLKRKITSGSNTWEYIVGNDNGGYDKYIAYKRSSTRQLSFGGAYPIGERVCSIPWTINGRVDTTKKHLISCHWMMSNSHVRVNNIISTDSSFTTNWEHVGAPFSSIFANKRLGSTPSYSLTAELYEIKIISGFLTPKDIDTMSKDMMREHKIVKPASASAPASMLA